MTPVNGTNNGAFGPPDGCPDVAVFFCLPAPRRCSMCGLKKAPSHFHACKRERDGLQSRCIACRSGRHYDGRWQGNSRRPFLTPEQRKASLAAAVRRWSRANPGAAAAHNAVHRAVRTGGLVAQPCVICGATGEAHHENYRQPLVVRWLCASHHGKLHREKLCLLPDGYYGPYDTLADLPAYQPVPLLRLTDHPEFIAYQQAYERSRSEDVGLHLELLDSFAVVRKALARLTYRQREVVKLRFGLADGTAYTLEEVARIFKLSKEGVRRIEAIALFRLRRDLGPLRRQEALA